MSLSVGERIALLLGKYQDWKAEATRSGDYTLYLYHAPIEVVGLMESLGMRPATPHVLWRDELVEWADGSDAMEWLGREWLGTPRRLGWWRQVWIEPAAKGGRERIVSYGGPLYRLSAAVSLSRRVAPDDWEELAVDILLPQEMEAILQNYGRAIERTILPLRRRMGTGEGPGPLDLVPAVGEAELRRLESLEEDEGGGGDGL